MVDLADRAVYGYCALYAIVIVFVESGKADGGRTAETLAVTIGFEGRADLTECVDSANLSAVFLRPE